ncbi:MAG: ABC transporter permease [Provencibacterium sp.]|jgi:ABC-2 type transport system permease protein|nr:ABC transporter permease [Provencibacterium sp.]
MSGRNAVYWAAFKKYRHLLRELVLRDIRLKFRRSVLGICWSVLNPLLMMLVITAVFQNLFRFDIEHFPIYYLTGSLVFNFVTEATSGAMHAVVSAGPLIRKVYIPKYIFPLEKCLFSFVNMLFSAAATAIMLLVLHVPVGMQALLFLLPLIYALVFSIGLGMALAALQVFFRDTAHLYGVFITAWLYLTPVIYPMEILPEWMLPVVSCNPLYYFVDFLRQVVLYRSLPGPVTSLCCPLFALAALFLGGLFFKKKQDRFILFI